MRRAIELAANGPAWGVNPQVGCVILSPDGVVLAEGWHRGAGTPHAEVDALANLSRASDAIGATAVVTLEPCNHTGRTGPCSEALVAAGISTVYFGSSDPGLRSGGGAGTLAAAGVCVHSGVLAAEVERSIHPWLTAMRNGRPFVTVKWASSLDGRAAAADGTSQWITGPDARADVHLRRSRADAIVVGTGTLLADDPSLTARMPISTGETEPALYPHQPQPVVIGERRIDRTARVFGHPLPVTEYQTRNLHGILADLFDRGVRSVFVEGGPTLASAFIRAGLADEIVAYLAPVLLGGPMLALGNIGVDGVADALPLTIVSLDLLGPDLRIVAEPLRGASSAASLERPVSSTASVSSPRASAFPTSFTSSPPVTPSTSDPKEHHLVHRNH
ncbi:bifunctional diaminohydroxyphosphoribosylaminopyrimidine deaminase/5-amino-6-(5-phosphoribosylamino)uracil reductase RibD [Subtercola sp. PAMC28395]|uniref:bifunctional diaminohydroxyphosphoribosylaminopyrimidine deaminase/5-amino-6-(5-phosphoribosylamino)uracil reductase RibD n=1 Tax=Subtercola sp. PAMC28395 TaxID=2846775 RepID=UPI001C0AE0EA|nr:bifunctional diaminohydroxyphosphoribosylaminopyrimidine deaminase/5-amino-6-(5-phosphoribosylamino)uracil reductase RibD [Subtercola sp. PAMC28395]QWT25310.1 bifunctional diaminohydroxyphosphoribosylaminopyrimidine deaminase/5-amino-6-(5-phosphoribosylamino)uracil reductase RibD [Subtercola sp. PAMC28395]